ncbi:hypothetical protein PPL_05804, partial [Heterostelium album PN500]
DLMLEMFIALVTFLALSVTAAITLSLIFHDSRQFTKMDKLVLVPIADGSEEMELSIIIDVLRRAGAKVTVASVSSNLQIDGSRHIKIVADQLIENIDNNIQWDLIALPGGMPGASNLSECNKLIELLKKQKAEHKLLAAICASPAVVLNKHSLLGNEATCYPAKNYIDQLGSKYIDQRVVVDRNIITSQGPATSFEFVLELVNQLYGPDKKSELAKQLVL